MGEPEVARLKRDLVAITLALVAVGLSLGAGAWVYRNGSSAKSATDLARTGGTVPSLRPGAKAAPPLTGNAEALMLAERSRDVLVGLAATTGGPIDLLVFPTRGSVTRGGLQARVNGSVVPTTGCGRACFRLLAPAMEGAPTKLTIEVRRRGSPAAVVRFRLPARLPPSGQRLLQAVDRRMGAVRSIEFQEVLTDGFGVVRTRYVAQAPDRLRFETSGGARTVLIGKRRWDWQRGRWIKSPFPRGRQPSYAWTGARNARIIGRAKLGAVPVQIIALYDDTYAPVWLRIYVARDRRVLRVEMLTQSHFMTHRFADFDKPITIEPPS